MPSRDTTRVVAVTFDDVPATALAGDPCDADALVGLNRRLLAHLGRFGVPATGLVTASRGIAPIYSTDG